MGLRSDLPVDAEELGDADTAGADMFTVRPNDSAAEMELLS